MEGTEKRILLLEPSDIIVIKLTKARPIYHPLLVKHRIRYISEKVRRLFASEFVSLMRKDPVQYRKWLKETFSTKLAVVSKTLVSSDDINTIKNFIRIALMRQGGASHAGRGGP